MTGKDGVSVAIDDERPDRRGEASIRSIEASLACEIDSRDVGFEVSRTDDRHGPFRTDECRDTEVCVVSDPDPAGVVALGEPDLDDRGLVGLSEDRERVLSGRCGDGHEPGHRGNDADEGDQGETEGGESAHEVPFLLAEECVEDGVDGEDDRDEEDDSSRSDSDGQDAVHSFSPFRNEGGKFSIAPLTPERKVAFKVLINALVLYYNNYIMSI